jgi:hypothetical protein
VVDHLGRCSAKPGAGTSVAETLHRSDEAIVKLEIGAAGFDQISCGFPRTVHSHSGAEPVDIFLSTSSNIQPHAYVCVGFRDHIVQRMEFDDHEDNERNWHDTDDCAC